MKPLVPMCSRRQVASVLPKVKAVLQRCLAKALLKKGVLAEAMLVKSPKMVVEPLMPKSLAKVMLM